MNQPEKPPAETTIGGKGDLLECPRHLRSDLQLVNRALKSRWPVTEKMREEILDEIYLLATCSPDERVRLNAGRAVIEADKLNMKEEERLIPKIHEHTHVVLTPAERSATIDALIAEADAKLTLDVQAHEPSGEICGTGEITPAARIDDGCGTESNQPANGPGGPAGAEGAAKVADGLGPGVLGGEVGKPATPSVAESKALPSRNGKH